MPLYFFYTMVQKSQRDELRIHFEEAMAIKSRKPELNRRQEELGTGFLPQLLTRTTFHALTFWHFHHVTW